MNAASSSPLAAGPRLVLPGAALLLLISSFLPWYHISIEGFGVSESVNESGWHEMGTFVFLLTIVLLAFEGVRMAGVLPLENAKADLVSVGLAAAVVLFGLIFVIIRLSDGYLGFGFWIGLIALIGVGAGAFLTLKSGGAMGALKEIQAQAQQKNQGGGTPPPPPPPPPSA